MTRGRTWAARSAAGGLLCALAAACSSGGSSSVQTINPAQTTVVTSSTTTAGTGQGLIPTAFNCGGGAYEPATLLVACGNAATGDTITVTDAKWTSWNSSGATGTGTVNLHVGGHPVSAPAKLALSKVVQTSNGAQFSLLTVTWTATSPDGHPSDQYPLAVAPDPSPPSG